MLVKNTLTGDKIEKKEAFIINVDGKNLFFSNENEYHYFNKLKESKKGVYNNFINTLNGIIVFDNKLYIIARRHVNSLMKSYDVVYLNYMFMNINLDGIGNNINFFSPLAKYNYFYKVITNKLGVSYQSYLKSKEKYQNKKIDELKSDRLFDLSKNYEKKERENILDFI